MKILNWKGITRTVMGVFLLSLTGCSAPLLIGGVVIGGAIIGGSLMQDRGLSGTINDASIRTTIRSKLTHSHPTAFKDVEVTVREGKVLVTGYVKSVENQIEGVRICWQVAGVHEVVDETQLEGGPNGEPAESPANDAWLTTRIRGELAITKGISSLNYSIKTVDGIVYVVGMAANQAELDRVLSVANGIEGVKRVVNYVKLRGQ